ncbi:glycosyltransferase family 2 protein [Candidatus Gottesmanbacteria bacterium]|nr:glycosyltransferase family 2 protein [Candidatus Gottesmanbacteria bacterium]
MKQTLTVIIPAFNEERTLSSVVEIVRSWGKAAEIFVVDDGSTDQTSKSVRQFVPDIRLIRHAKNQGKASAMVDGVVKSRGDIIMFLDADTVGLTHRDLDAMVTPVIKGSADMVLGAARFWSAGKFEPFNSLTGQRVILRKHIMPHIPDMRGLGYGVELFLNKKHESLRVRTVRLPHVFILGKLDKQTLPDAFITYIKEIRELLLQLLTQYADEIGPHAKRIVKEVIRYTLRIIDMLLS